MWMTLDEKLANYIPEPNTGCWLWLGNCDTNGYGKVSHDGRYHLAHRFFYQHMVGHIPDGLFVLHHCDTPACVNPHHMHIGGPKENGADMVKRGRASKVWGIPHPRTRLTAAQALEIRLRYHNRMGNQYQLAKEYGVCQGVIWKIVSDNSYTGAEIFGYATRGCGIAIGYGTERPLITPEEVQAVFAAIGRHTPAMTTLTA